MGGLLKLGVPRAQHSDQHREERASCFFFCVGCQDDRTPGPLTRLVSLESLSACRGLQLRTSLQTRRG